jgi:hypothetical protein
MMEFLKQFWKSWRSYKDLAKGYQTLSAKNEVYSNLYEKAKSKKDMDDEIETARNLLENSIERTEIMIDLCRFYCPTTARRLRSRLKAFEKLPNHDFESYRNNLRINPKYRVLTAEMIDDLTRDAIKNALTFMRVHDQNVDLVASSIMETAETLERPYILQKSQYIESELSKFDVSFSKLYVSAWRALQSNSLDRCRQCCTSLRKLLNDIIDTKGVGKDREQKLKYILKGKDKRFAKAFIRYVTATISLLNKGIHTEMKMKETTFALTMVEDAILFLLE